MVLQPSLDGEQQLDSATSIVANGAAPEVANDRYIVPSTAPQVVPAAALAGYVMAHSAVAGPLSSVLSEDESEFSEPTVIELTNPAADDTEPRSDPNLRRQP